MVALAVPPGPESALAEPVEPAGGSGGGGTTDSVVVPADEA
jgi:hypothetical protein